MSIDEALVLTGENAAAEIDEPYSAGWWERRSPEELRDIINRGFRGGAAFEGAASETERRAREAARRLRQEAARDTERRNQRNRRVLMAIAALGAIANAALWYFG